MQEIGTAAKAASYTDGIEQFLSFALGDQEYGIEILKVQEIKGYSGITPIPNTAAHIRGVMNLRGTVIPVVDLRAKFSMETRAYDKFTVIIVVTVGTRIMGLVVDSVSDVLDIARGDIRPTPDLGRREDTRFISGMANVADRLVVLLDIDTLLAEDSSTDVVSAGKTA